MDKRCKIQYADDILPSFSSNNVAVVFEVSNPFVPYLSVAILSLIASSTHDYNYDIIVLTNEIEQHDSETLQSLCRDKPNICIRFFDPSQMVKTYIATAKYEYLNLNYYRMSLPWILKNYTKVVNLGADIIIRRDIADLFYERMDAATYIGGVMDIGYQGRLSLDISKKELGLENPYEYINADVLILDLEKIRRDFTQDELMESWQKRRFRCAEQDALNWFFSGHIYQLDLRWNVFPEKMSSEYDIMHAPEASRKAWRNCLDNPYIVHYAASPKPWQLPTVGYGLEWWYIAKRSPYYEKMLKAMCEYLETHGTFNIIESDARRCAEKILPHGSIRRKIAKTLIPRGSKRWCLLKKFYYALGAREH